MNSPREFGFDNGIGPSLNSIDIRCAEDRARAIRELSMSILELETEYESIESEARQIRYYTPEHVKRIEELLQQLALLKGIQSKLIAYNDRAE